MRGAEEEEHGVLESVLLLSPLLVEGISANTVETDNRLNLLKSNLMTAECTTRAENSVALFTITGPLGEFRRYSVGGHPPTAGDKCQDGPLVCVHNTRHRLVFTPHTWAQLLVAPPAPWPRLGPLQLQNRGWCRPRCTGPCRTLRCRLRPRRGPRRCLLRSLWYYTWRTLFLWKEFSQVKRKYIHESSIIM